ncbi:hypothetical protein [Bosea sp. R86505]|uniref:hypothetical protein n=1 Tax=Bosea sp. R86505 TaxID=3101710 RepID=UPI00366B75A0
MSAPSFTSSSEAASRGFLRWLAGGCIAAAALIIALALVVDPYGISPLRLSAQGFNALKPKRKDIDRLIKPIEVWQKQPRTVFLGTSRIHQSIDPAVLEGSSFAPAYNASVPAVSLGMNVAYLDLYGRIAPTIEQAFVEIYLYNFVGQGQAAEPMPAWHLLRDAVSLTFSGTAVIDSLITLAHNRRGHRATYEVRPGGYFFYPPGHDPSGTFSAFPAGMWDIFRRSGKLALSDEAFASVDRMIETAKRRNITLTFLATPNHAYFDYFIDTVDGWGLVEEWLTRLAAKAEIYSFAQPNAWSEEAPASRMVYWNDPIHFSLEVGKAMQLALLGRPEPGTPENFLVKLTPETVKAHVAQRRDAIRAWTQRNLPFALTFENARGDLAGGAGTRLAALRAAYFGGHEIGSAEADALLIGSTRHPIVARFAGALESASLGPVGITATGWAADQAANGPVKAIVAVVGSRIVARSEPIGRRIDIEQNIASGASPASFALIAPIDVSRPSEPVIPTALIPDRYAPIRACRWM